METTAQKENATKETFQGIFLVSTDQFGQSDLVKAKTQYPDMFQKGEIEEHQLGGEKHWIFFG